MKLRMTDYCFIATWICALTLAILYTGSQESLNKFHEVECDIQMLQEEAPETLTYPPTYGFTTPEKYIQAFNAYLKYGTWATLVDGYNCTNK